MVDDGIVVVVVTTVCAVKAYAQRERELAVLFVHSAVWSLCLRSLL